MSESNLTILSPGVFRLPGLVVPTYYNLTLEPNIDKLSFDGHVDIEVDIKQRLNIITLHSKELEIYNVKLINNHHVEPIYFEAEDISYELDKTLVNLKFNTTINTGDDFRLSMDFKGRINTQESFGLYYSNLTDASGLTHHLLSTQFEHNYARRAFPCWDEPGFKAKFDVALLVPKNLTALSNTKVKQLTKHQNNWHYQFETTPIMSTYTLAYAIGDLEYIEATAPGYHREEPIRCRMYTLRGYSNQTRIAMDATIKSLGFFEEYFDIPYTLDKIDLIAVPSHDALAMENWGLVTIKHSEMVLDDDNNEKTRNRVIFITAHEIAHQWFGNLATPKTWDDLWLNEAFATYFGNLASELLYPEYDFKHFLSGFYIRYLKSIRENKLSPIRLNNFDVDNDKSYETMITVYGKGAVMLDILDSLISKAKLNEFSRNVLNRFKFTSAEAKDIYSILPNLPGFNSSEFIETWIESKNYPHLTVSENYRNSSHMILTITQGPILIESKNPIWYIPFDLVFENITSQSLILSDKSTSVIVPKDTSYKVTPAGFGYIKVNYKVTDHSNFYQQVADPRSVIYDDYDRIELIQNTLQLYKSSTIDPSTVIDLIKGFSKCSNVEIISWLMDVSDQFIKTWSNLNEFDLFYRPIEKQWYSHFSLHINWKMDLDNNNITQKIGQQALLHSVLNGNKNLFSAANATFHQFIKGNLSVVSSSMRTTLFRMVLNQEDSSNINHLLSMFDSGLTKQHKGLGHDIVTSLGYCHPNNLEYVLSWAATKRSVVLAWLISYLRPNQGYDQRAWYFLKEHWSELEEFDADDLEFTVSATTYSMMTPDTVDPIVAFMASQNKPELKDTISRLIQRGQVYQQNYDSVLHRLNHI